MTLRQIIGGIILLPSMFAIPLVWLSGAILHFYTALIAYGIAGPGWRGYVAAGGVLMLPVIGQIAVFIGAGSVTGNFLNGYSERVFLLLLLVGPFVRLLAVGVRIGKTQKER